MRQMSIFDLNPKNWIEKTEELLERLIIEYELPEKALYLRETKNENYTISSMSLCISEPDYTKSP